MSTARIFHSTRSKGLDAILSKPLKFLAVGGGLSRGLERDGAVRSGALARVARSARLLRSDLSHEVESHLGHFGGEGVT